MTDYTDILRRVRAIVYETSTVGADDATAHAIAGLAEETLELCEAETAAERRAEAGDVLWYLVALMDVSGVDLADVADSAAGCAISPMADPWLLTQLREAMAAAKRVARGDDGAHARLAVGLGRLLWATCEVGGDPDAVVTALGGRLRDRMAPGVIRGDGGGR